MTVAVGARNLFKVDAGVVHALMQARYQNAERGQFISEDPLFVGGPMPDLNNPQNQNAYSYSNDNPINKSDPSGLLVSEYQPYLPSGSDYKGGELVGSYRGVNISSRGPAVSAINSPYQCTDFAKQFIGAQFNGASLKGIGNAVNYGNQSLVDASFKQGANTSGSFMVYSNGGTVMPQQNDLISWSGSVGGIPTGHVGVIAEVLFNKQSGTGSVYTVEQNFGYQKGLFVQPLVTGTNANGDATYSVVGRSSSEQTQAWTRYGNQSTVPTYTSTLYSPAT